MRTVSWQGGRWAVLGAILAVLSAVPSRADWTSDAFPERSYDFGKVARGSKLRHSFPIVNKTSSPIRITNWQTKCGCTEVKVGSMTIPPGAQTFVEATLDTTKFQGHKSSGLTLVLDQPVAMQLDLGLECYIEPALVLTPGLVDFGTVLRTARPQTTLLLNYSGGVPGWQVTSMKTISAALSARIEQVGTTESGGPQYRLTATLDPSGLRDGRFKDEITLVTNDPNMPQIPVSVSGKVQSTVSLSPAVVDLGTLKPGATASKTILMRSANAFKLTAAASVQGEATFPPPTEESKNLHVLNVTFKAPSEPGSSHTIVELKTDIEGEPPLRLTAFINVAP